MIRRPSCPDPSHRDSNEVCIFESVWSRIDSGMVLFDVSQHQLLWANHPALRLLEKVKATPDYQTLRQLFLPDLSEFSAGVKLRRLQEVCVGAVVLGYSVYRTSEVNFVVLLRDITEQRRLETIAETANLMENIGYVFGGIRHELGNPINTIKMTLSVLRRNLDAVDTAKVADAIDRTLEEVTRVEYLLNNLKSFTIYDTPVLAPLNLAAAVERFAHLVRGDMEQRGIALTTRVSQTSRWVMADARTLQQVLLNLVTNAVDALAGRSGARIELITEAHHERILLKVRDNGVGMGADQLANLFKPFRTTKPRGTGLGMVIVKKMLSAMGASLEVASQVDHGTTMTISMPRALPQPDPAPDAGGST